LQEIVAYPQIEQGGLWYAKKTEKKTTREKAYQVEQKPELIQGLRPNWAPFMSSTTMCLLRNIDISNAPFPSA
jgi:hypothetical protein